MYYGRRPQHSKRGIVRRVMLNIIVAVCVIAACVGLYFMVTYGVKYINEKNDSEQDFHTQYSTTSETNMSTSTKPTELTVENRRLSLLTPKAIIYSLTDHQTEYKLDAEAMTSPGSLTLLWAAKTALGAVDKNVVFTVGPEVKRARASAPTAFLKQGQKLKLYMLVDAMLVSGGEDAAYVIAVNCGRKITGNAGLTEQQAVDAFIAEMNTTAAELGLKATKFMNFTGQYHADQKTTASDMMTLMNNVVSNEQIKTALGKRSVRHVYVSGEDITWFNPLDVLKPNTNFYSKLMQGAYLGYTKEDGYTGVSIVNIDGKETLIVLLGAKTPADIWKDVLLIVNEEQPSTTATTKSGTAIETGTTTLLQ